MNSNSNITNILAALNKLMPIVDYEYKKALLDASLYLTKYKPLNPIEVGTSSMLICPCCSEAISIEDQEIQWPICRTCSQLLDWKIKGSN